MRHPDEDRLHDLVDGLPGGDDAGEVQEHLASCERCRDRVEALRRLTSDLAALPREIPPRRDLRPGVGDEVRAPARGSRLGPWLRAAAAVAALVAAGAGIWLGLLAPEARVTRPEDPIVAPYVRASGDLATELRGRRSELSPAAARALDASLRALDRAIDQLERARARPAPDEAASDAALTRRLEAVHRTRLELLRSAASLLEET